MITFDCNICGGRNSTEMLSWETPVCSGCGANARMRALIYMLSLEFLGEAVPLWQFPKMKNRCGLGFTDNPGYASILAEKFDYANTFYHCEPFFDITARHADLYGKYDFIISSEVFEHIAVPVERALEEAFNLLKPDGRLFVTVPSSVEEKTIEHYPDLHRYAIVELDGKSVLLNRKKDGSFQLHENPIFHGGSGTTLEMRLFSRKDLTEKLHHAGFAEVHFLDANAERFGIMLVGPWSHPLVARSNRQPTRSESSSGKQVPDL